VACTGTRPVGSAAHGWVIMERRDIRWPLMLGLAASGLLLLAVALGACSSSPDPEPTAEAHAEAAAEVVEVDPAVAAQQRLLEQELERLVRERAVAPGAVGVLSTPHGTTVAAFGDAVREPPRPLIPDEPWPVASITKTFTAVVVLQLVSEGALALDDPVEAWLPGVLPADDRVTVRHLLSHRSGIVEDDELYENPDESCRTWTADEFLGYAVAIPTSPPGANYRYSNVGYVALGRLVETVTGESYERAVQDRILDPLGLADTRFPDAGATAAHEVRGYLMPPVVDEADGPLDVTCTLLGTGAVLAMGGLVSTVTDVATFYAALLDGHLLEPGLLDAMQRAESPHYGLGLQLDRTTCGHARGHDGRLPGFAIAALASVDAQTTVVLALNGQGRPARVDQIVESTKRLFCEVAP
jgi:D-alanyl-D-alanine carboxypeptidase